MAEWLERRAEEHVYSRCAGSKPARASVMTCLWLSKRVDIYVKGHNIHTNVLLVVKTCQFTSFTNKDILLYYIKTTIGIYFDIRKVCVCARACVRVCEKIHVTQNLIN